jgi:hypothetical protein
MFNLILEEIIKRKRTAIPMVVLTGTRFGEYSSKYSIYDINRTILEKDKFIFKNNTSGKINFDDYKYRTTNKQVKFIFDNNTSVKIDFDDYKKELIYLKIFTKKIHQTINTNWIDLTRCVAIIKINDMTDKVFYMYIKLGIKGFCDSCDGDNVVDYRIVYSSSFDDLVNFIYKPKQIPNFLDSNAFVSKEDKTIEQYTIIKNYKEMFIKKIEYDTIFIIVDLKKSTLTTTISGKTYSTKYKIKKDKWFVNQIITKGSDTISIRTFVWINGVDVSISNNNETLKEFFLSTK